MCLGVFKEGMKWNQNIIYVWDNKLIYSWVSIIDILYWDLMGGVQEDSGA